nr:hypothetical protein Iba_chr02bCG8050 [Ipomoea batatas]GMC66393.1 hypothetical protein Iba_chr02eCG5300 [Ipomoea batatas]
MDVDGDGAMFLARGRSVETSSTTAENSERGSSGDGVLAVSEYSEIGCKVTITRKSLKRNAIGARDIASLQFWFSTVEIIEQGGEVANNGNPVGLEYNTDILV